MNSSMRIVAVLLAFIMAAVVLTLFAEEFTITEESHKSGATMTIKKWKGNNLTMNSSSNLHFNYTGAGANDDHDGNESIHQKRTAGARPAGTENKRTSKQPVESATNQSISQQPGDVSRKEDLTRLSFSGQTLTGINEPMPYSYAQCLSENFQPRSHQYRSCQYHNMCYNMETTGFELHYSPRHHRLLFNQTADRAEVYLSSKSKSILITPSSRKSLKKGRGQWEPEELITNSDTAIKSYYYALPDNVIWIPIFPFKDCKSGGEALWDVLLPIYTLLELFDLLSKKPVLLVTELRNPKINCRHVWKEFEKLMGFTMHPLADMVVMAHDDRTNSTTVVANTSALQSKFVCSRRALGGTGYLMDHGAQPELSLLDSKVRRFLPAPHNIRRAHNLQGFREYLLSNSGAVVTADPDPTRVTFCIQHLSAVPRLDTLRHAVEKNAAVQVNVLDLSNGTTMMQQLKMLQTTSILVVMGASVVNSALFLPKGATLIFYSTSPRGDSDVWINNAGLRVHFLIEKEGIVVSQMDNMLVHLIQDELAGLKASVANKMKMNDDTEKVSNISSAFFANISTVTLVHDRPPTSRVHCIGDNGKGHAWLYRSCHYENLCFDLNSKSFVAFPSDSMRQLMNETKETESVVVSSIPNQLVISGGQKRNGLMKGDLGWQPEIQDPDQVTSYYQLAADTVWISFHPHPNCNGGHLLWDCILPVFSLLDTFNLTEKELLLSEFGSERACDQEIMEILNLTSPVQRNAQLDIVGGTDGAQQSNLVCTANSANGMAWLTDHGLNGHGKLTSDFSSPVNMRRGPELLRFRNFLLKRWNLRTDTTGLKESKRVVFSILSSRSPERRFDFAEQIAAVKEKLPDVEVDGIAMWKHTWEQQAKIATETAVYVSIVGGGTSSAFFLPKGSSLILLSENFHMLDWDLWNNYAHIRVHWLPIPHMHRDTSLLVDLIRDELESLDDFQ